jgi:hypothetical protein
MSDAMKIESLNDNREPLTGGVLPAGQRSAEIEAGGLPFLGSGPEVGVAGLEELRGALFGGTRNSYA